MDRNPIGKVINGIRRTEHGFVKESGNWWFFQRVFPDKESPYWYAKKRDEENNEIIEEYVGVTLPFTLPRGLMTTEEYGRYSTGELIIEPENDLRDIDGNNQG